MLEALVALRSCWWIRCVALVGHIICPFNRPPSPQIHHPPTFLKISDMPIENCFTSNSLPNANLYPFFTQMPAKVPQATPQIAARFRKSPTRRTKNRSQPAVRSTSIKVFFLAHMKQNESAAHRKARREPIVCCVTLATTSAEIGLSWRAVQKRPPSRESASTT